jgi:hypothetical protein
VGGDRTLNLEATLPALLPRAVAWAEACATEAAATGAPLDEPGLVLARAVGVRRPGRVRVALVEALPAPEEPALREAAIAAGLLRPSREGLTLGYSVFLRRGQASPRLLSHELRHVHQYERAGSIAAFLPVYLRQIIEFGYRDAPLERDARRHETS